MSFTRGVSRFAQGPVLRRIALQEHGSCSKSQCGCSVGCVVGFGWGVALADLARPGAVAERSRSRGWPRQRARTLASGQLKAATAPGASPVAIMRGREHPRGRRGPSPRRSGPAFSAGRG